MNAAAPIERVLQGAFDLLLADSPEARAECAALAGRTIAVELTDLRMGVGLAPQVDGGLRVTLDVPADADARIRAGAGDLLRLLRSRGAHGAPGRLHIDGDAQVAQRFRTMLQLAVIDPEERLAAIVGDVPAHEIGRLWRGMASFGEEVIGAFATMAGEWLHYESRDLPTRHEVERFLRDVDTLRDDVARAEARITRLARNTDPGTRSRSGEDGGA